jgi:hypothetical protein
MAKEIYIAPAKRKFLIPDHVWNVLAVYKIMWPGHVTVRLGKKKVVKLSEIFPWPPPEQESLLTVESVDDKSKKRKHKPAS